MFISRGCRTAWQRKPAGELERVLAARMAALAGLKMKPASIHGKMRFPVNSGQTDAGKAKPGGSARRPLYRLHNLLKISELRDAQGSNTGKPSVNPVRERDSGRGAKDSSKV